MFNFLVFLTLKTAQIRNFSVYLYIDIKTIVKHMTEKNIQEMIDAMSVEEMKNRLADYMIADETICPCPIGVEVRLSENFSRKGRYDVLLIMKDGSEVEVKFRDRHSRLIYIYTLLHPQGFQRRSLETNNYKALKELFSKIYFTTTEPLMKAIGDKFNQYLSQAISQSRVAVREAAANTKDFESAMPTRNGGKTIIDWAAKGGEVIIDNSLL